MSYWRLGAPQSRKQGRHAKITGGTCSHSGLWEILGFRDQKVERQRRTFGTLTGSQELFRGGRSGMLEAVEMQKGGVQFSGDK